MNPEGTLMNVETSILVLYCSITLWLLIGFGAICIGCNDRNKAMEKVLAITDTDTGEVNCYILTAGNGGKLDWVPFDATYQAQSTIDFSQKESEALWQQFKQDRVNVIRLEDRVNDGE